MSIFYPDNPKRQRRLEELASDCAAAVQAIGGLYERIERANERVSERVSSALADLKRPAPRYGDVVISVPAGHRCLAVLGDLHPVFVAESVERSLRKAAAGFLFRSGAIDQDLLRSAVGLPVWMAFPGGAITAVAIEEIYDALTGSRRKKLREGIRDALRLRLELRVAQTVNESLFGMLDQIADAVEALTRAGYDEEDLNRAVQRRAAAARDEILKLDDRACAERLDRLDRSRGSWTAEDRVAT